MVQGKLKVNQSSPDLTCLQMLTHTVCSSLYYLLRFLLIAALYVMILDCKVDKALPKLDLSSVVPYCLLKSIDKLQICLLFLSKLYAWFAWAFLRCIREGYSILLNVVIVERILLGNKSNDVYILLWRSLALLYDSGFIYVPILAHRLGLRGLEVQLHYSTF